jgi:hypothetical protein
MIWMYEQSSVMDYPGDVSQDTLGLGSYDFAAARMFYGDVTSVYTDKSFLSSTPNGLGIIAVTDNFGGLAGIKYQTGSLSNPTQFHYSQLQANYKLIQDCIDVTPAAPTWWRPDVDGQWDQVFDGKVVNIKGKASKCRSQFVDYLGWNQLRLPTVAEGNTPPVGNAGPTYRGGNAVEITGSNGMGAGRTRVPYSFASDNWADTGNVSVFRHDNGADPYEQMQFLITTQEDRHILDNFRRGRTTFNIRSASDRSYQRYNEKMYDLSNGMGFIAGVYKDFAIGQGYTFDSLWPLVLQEAYQDNIIGASVAFDHFTRELSRPESGQHYFLSDVNGNIGSLPVGLQDNTLRSANDPDGNPPSAPDLIVPEGSTGYLGIEMTPGVVGSIGFGGHLLENGLATNEGDYDTDYPWNCGSYYDKINSAILLSDSEDRFISQSRQDFYDARFRAAGMEDVFPDGWRRVLANALTNDRSLLAPHVTADASGLPILSNQPDPYNPTNKDPLSYPAQPIGWTSWWPTEGPTPCFSLNGSNVCAAYDGIGGGFNPQVVPNTVGIDPQIGWEVQKFIIAWTLAYLPATQESTFVDMLRIYQLGPSSNPALTNYVEYQDPNSQQVYYAQTYGSECLFGSSTATTAAECLGPDPINTPNGASWVQKGIAARVLEYANYLISMGYSCDPAYANPPAGIAPGFDANGMFHVARMNDGTPVVRYDPYLINAQNGSAAPAQCDLDVPVDCDPTITTLTDPNYCGVTKLHANGCTAPLDAGDNHYSAQVAPYKSVPDYLWQVMSQYGLATPAQLGKYP